MKTTLIIEDDDSLIRMYEQAFSAMEVPVVFANRGKDGLIKAKELKPGVILLDVMMPEMSGLEVLTSLKNDPELKDIPVIMLTNLTGPSIETEARQKRVVDFLNKSSFKPREIVEKVKSFVAS